MSEYTPTTEQVREFGTFAVHAASEHPHRREVHRGRNRPCLRKESVKQR